MEIIRLEPAEYAGKPFRLTYETKGYYDIRPEEATFAFEYRALPHSETHVDRDVMFSEWLDDPVAYGAFEGDALLGFAEGFLEKWNNRFRVSNIVVFAEENRHLGLGARLFEKMLEEAVGAGARMLVLETQSCNERAIAFYRRQGLEVIGFDLYAYTNEDPQRREVRVEMGRMLPVSRPNAGTRQ